MPIRELEIALSPEKAGDEEVWKKAVARKLKVLLREVQELRLLKKSLDARKRPVCYRLRFLVGVGEVLPPISRFNFTPNPKLQSGGGKDVIVVGSGPAGLFAALRLLELGCRPIVLERGKDVSSRRFDLAPILRKGTVIEDSNYCFGEGGAGTFSDGKLYTRATKRGPVQWIYEVLVAHGAPKEILTDAHPHIGSNLLPNVVREIRNSIIEAGGEVHFEQKVSELLVEKGRLLGVKTAEGKDWLGGATILATGHSARDIYRMLEREGVALEAKPFAVGVRIEHPQPQIDKIQYHLRGGEKRGLFLPAARYRLATKIEGRGVHSFCMCPGGFIVPAATENDEVVVNGMSLSRRDSPFANSGIVVGVEPEDLAGDNPLRGIVFQKNLEKLAKDLGGGGQVAPAQFLEDFIQARASGSLPKTSYFPGVNSARLDEALPDFISNRIKRGLKKFGAQMKGYRSEEALLLGFETRTSSPVKIPRDPETGEHPSLKGLFPCGEGAGYAGGIVSAALDGRKSAQYVA